MLGSILDFFCFFWPDGKKEKIIFLEDAGLLLDKELSNRIQLQFGDIKIEEKIIPLFNLIGPLREEKKSKSKNKKEFSVNIIHNLGDMNLKPQEHKYRLVVVINHQGQIFIVKVNTKIKYGIRQNTITEVSLLGKYKIWNSKELLSNFNNPKEMDLEIVEEPDGLSVITQGLKFFYILVINYEDIDKEKGLVQETTSIKQIELKEFGYKFVNYSIEHETRQRHTIIKK